MRVNIKGKSENLPDFIIVGAARSGTTSLYYYLSQHPQIFLPDRKEPQFLSYRGQGIQYDNVVKDLDEYVDIFKASGEKQVIGEASTSYLYMYDSTIDSIKEIYGERFKDLKIIMLLRDPVKRAYSHYLFMAKQGFEDLAFEEAIKPDVIATRIVDKKGFDYIGHSMYYERVKSFVDQFPNVRIYIDADLKRTDDLVEDVLEYLGVDTNIKVNTDVIVNPSGIAAGKGSRLIANLLVKKSAYIKRFIPGRFRMRLINLRDSVLRRVLVSPPMAMETREKLCDLFLDDVLKLQHLIQRDLSQWQCGNQRAKNRIT